MSHGFLVNCLQCHATPPPKPFAHLDVVAANNFVGLPAPTSGERAFPGAPPVIPHSTWMRERCLSCHGGVAGWPGLEVTHRWRTNCKQCHALSAQLEPAVVADAINFVSEFDAQQP
jgi:cytochrome c-type protein NapB